jgi:uncharacterized protein
MRIIVFALLFLSLYATAQSQPAYNVVFDLTSKDTNTHKSVLRWLTNISQANPDAKLEVVLYGQSLDMVRKGKSVIEEPLVNILSRPNVTVSVCASAMKRHGITTSELITGVKTVPDGIYQIITRQSQGWGYIKAQ